MMSKQLIKILVASGFVEFSQEQKQQLSSLGVVTLAKNNKEYSVDEFVALAKGADYVAFNPEVLGGFEGLYQKFETILPQLPALKGIALGTTSFGYIPLDLIKKQGISVSHVPGYSRESVAEHTLLMMLGAAKRLFVTDRKTQLDQFQLEEGFELANRTLGVIGLGSIGSRVAQLGRSIGMDVIAWDRKEKYLPGMKQLPLDEVLSKADVISLHLSDNRETHQFLSKNKIKLLKRGAIVVNTASRELVDETAMAKALQKKQVDSYVFEAEDLSTGPLANCPNAILLKCFSWYTSDSLERNKKIWVENITSIVQGNAENIEL